MGLTVGRRSDFNPRSRMGSDRRHAVGSTQPEHFNPRSRMGSDHGVRPDEVSSS